MWNEQTYCFKGIMSIILLKGSQAMLARPFDIDRVKAKMWQIVKG